MFFLSFSFSLALSLAKLRNRLVCLFVAYRFRKRLILCFVCFVISNGVFMCFIFLLCSRSVLHAVLIHLIRSSLQLRVTVKQQLLVNHWIRNFFVRSTWFQHEEEEEEEKIVFIRWRILKFFNINSNLLPGVLNRRQDWLFSPSTYNIRCNL